MVSTKERRVDRSSKERGTKARMGRVGSNAGKKNSRITDGTGRGDENDHGGGGGRGGKEGAVGAQ